MNNKNGFAIISILIMLTLIIVVGGLGYFLLSNKEGKDISTLVIPTECQSFQDDVCSLFECMVDLCWCDDSSPESPILYDTYIAVNDEQGAKDAVYAYIAELIYGDNKLVSEEAKKMKINNVVKLNAVFYNVFVDKEGEEIVYTVSKNGQILVTICGI